MQPTCTYSRLPELQGLQDFLPISLSDMDSVHLLNRVDCKYALHISQLPGLLCRLAAHYQVLEIDHRRFFRYSTAYFDTPDLLLYQAHHNGRSNRIKVRCRQYLDTGQCFFEIKQKLPGNRTHKLRYELDAPLTALDEKASTTVRQQFQRQPLNDLALSLYNTFSRTTLVNPHLGERCTIDLNINFQSPDGRTATAADLVVVEIKQAHTNPLSPMIQALRKESIFPCSFSKYIYGLMHTRPALKHNAFKPLLHRLEKIKNRFTPPSHPCPTTPLFHQHEENPGAL